MSLPIRSLALLAASLAVAVGAGAATSADIVSGPAAVTQGTTSSSTVVSVTPVSNIIIVPVPKPPLPPNSCNRGNAGGVSRC